MTRIFETELQRHPGIAAFERRTVDKVLDLINGCDRGRHDFSLLDADPAALSCFQEILWGEFVLPSAGKRMPRLPDGAEHGKELCPRSNDAAMWQSAENNKVVTSVKEPGRRGPKFHRTPDDLIMTLANQGKGARKIAADLERQGFRVNVRTVTRRLSRLKAAELPLFEN